MNDDVFRPGELCGTYRIVRLLDPGRFADVYKAVDVTTHRKVALKCLKVRYLKSSRITQRMVAETELLSGLEHPNLVQVEDAGLNGGVLWLATEYLSGKMLRERLRPVGKPLEPEVALYYARQIGEGIAAAHEVSIIHRDLKPENIMITSKDEVKILDLGAAKFFDSDLALSGEEATRGLLYMSPEQIKAEVVDFRADVYAVGMILYEMLAGRHPFAQPNGKLPPAKELAQRQLNAQPTPLTDLGNGVSVAVWKIVERAIAKDPDDRFASMANFVSAIRTELRSAVESPGATYLWDPPKAVPEAVPLQETTTQSAESSAPTVSQAALPDAPEVQETLEKNSQGPLVPNGGADDDDEPLSGVRYVALSPAPKAPPPKPAPPPLARVIRIGPGGRMGEIAPALEPAAAPLPDEVVVPAAMSASLASSAEEPAPPVVAEQAPPAVAEQAPPVVAEQAPPAVAEQAPPAVAEQAPPVAPEVAAAPDNLEEIAAPPAAVVTLVARLRAALRARSRAAVALVPLLGVLLAVALRPPTFVPFAQSTLPAVGPLFIAATLQPSNEPPSPAEPSLANVAPPPVLENASPVSAARPPKPKIAHRARGSIQGAPAPRDIPVSFASPEECGKLLVLASTSRCSANKVASATAPDGHNKL